MKILSIAAFTVFLYACSDTSPIQLTEGYKQYIGTWQQRIEEKNDTSLKIDNMLLSINADSTAVYRKCKVNTNKSEGVSRSSSSSINFPEAVVTQISKSSITVAQKLGWFGFDVELTINQAPYQENQQWYIEIEGKRLAKLSSADQQTMTNWECPSTKDEN